MISFDMYTPIKSPPKSISGHFKFYCLIGVGPKCSLSSSSSLLSNCYSLAFVLTIPWQDHHSCQGQWIEASSLSLSYSLLSSTWYRWSQPSPLAFLHRLFPSFLSWLLPFPFSWLLLLKSKYWSASRLNCLLSKLITHVSHKRHRFNHCVGKILLRRKMATISSIHAWKMPWTEAPGKLQSKGSQRVGYNWATKHTCMHVTLNIIWNWWKSPNFSFWLQFLP